jgi:hypothetical protein
MAVCDQWYSQMINIRPRLADVLPRAAFLHISRLFWTARIEQVNFAVTGRKPNATTRAPIPSKVQVPQPIWEMLKSLGKVKNETTGQIFLPKTVLPNAQQPDQWNEEYERALIRCIAQDWHTSWIEASASLEERDANQHRVDQHDAARNDQSPAEMLGAIGIIYDLIKAIGAGRVQIQHPREEAANAVEEHEDPDEQAANDAAAAQIFHTDDDNNEDDFYEFRGNRYTRREYPRLFTEVARNAYLTEVRNEIVRWKRAAQAWNPTLPSKVKPIQFRFIVEPADPEVNFGLWLGWSPELWHRYEEFVHEASQIALFSLSFPNEIEGSMAWVLPVRTNQYGEVACMPSNDVPPNAICMAIVLKSSLWEYSKHHEIVSGWNLLSDPVASRQEGIVRWILKSFTTPAQVAPNYYVV